MSPPIRMTEFAHGGGCGCKLAPAVLSELLAKMPVAREYSDLLIGANTADDAAVYRINDRQAVVATTDFFMPIVDDPFDFGRIAATNALSDLYAMGSTPIFALAIVGMPVDTLPVDAVQRILAGGASVCEVAGIPLAGGHSIDSPEPIYGLAAVGIVDPDRLMRNSTARPGDTLILTKPLGIGIYSAALKRGELDDASYGEMLETTTQLNAVGVDLPDIAGVHSVTDVTGFGILGHLLEMCRGADLAAEITVADLPVFPNAVRLSQAGTGTGAAKRNWASYGDDVVLPDGMPDWQRDLLCDPQTSGGLLISCAPEDAPRTLDVLASRGFQAAAIIGAMRSGTPRIEVR